MQNFGHISLLWAFTLKYLRLQKSPLKGFWKDSVPLAISCCRINDKAVLWFYHALVARASLNFSARKIIKADAGELFQRFWRHAGNFKWFFTKRSLDLVLALHKDGISTCANHKDVAGFAESDQSRRRVKPNQDGVNNVCPNDAQARSLLNNQSLFLIQ